MSKMLFDLGAVVSTHGAMEAMQSMEPSVLLRRHVSGDWGETCEEDKKWNDLAVKDGSRIMSVYTLLNGETVWIITEADRLTTTFILPEEY